MHAPDFTAMHRALRSQVDREFLAGVSCAILQDRKEVDRFCVGMADREAAIPLREDHIFRVFSNSKLVTSCAALLLVEEGRLGLDDPVERYIPELGQRRVLRAGATRLDDTEPARRSITVRHLMTHTSGLSYGIFDPGSLMFQAYNAAQVMNPTEPLATMMQRLAPLPLSFHPGERWEYSVATDVVARLVEVVSGETFGAFLARRIFGPLGMVDTDFWVPPAKQSRLCALYIGDPADPTRPGLRRLDDKPWPGAYLQKMPRESGGGGLVSTLDDMVRLVRSLCPGRDTLLRPETLSLMATNQLPPGLCVQFPDMPRIPQRGFGLGSAVTTGPVRGEPAACVGEVSWGGLAGTVWWFNPRTGMAAVLMTQRYFGTGHAYAIEFKRNAYAAFER